MQPDVSIDAELRPLMEALDEDRDGPRVVAIGGGHGLAQALLGIQMYAGHIDAIVSVADDGGSSGRLAPALDIPPPGDIRRCLIAMTPDRSVWRDLFEYRFADGDVAGHSLGNLMLAGLTELHGDFEAALRSAERLLDSVGAVIPAAPHRLRLEAVVDGNVVNGQASIAASRGVISKLRLIPNDLTASKSAIEAIARADQIVLGPGSLYTSTLATLLVPGIAEAVVASDAKLVYVLNLVTQDGETLGMDAADHLDALLAIGGIRPPSTMIVNAADVSVPAPNAPLTCDVGIVETYGVDVATADLVDETAEWPRHDPSKLGRALAAQV